MMPALKWEFCLVCPLDVVDRSTPKDSRNTRYNSVRRKRLTRKLSALNLVKGVPLQKRKKGHDLLRYAVRYVRI